MQRSNLAEAFDTVPQATPPCRSGSMPSSLLSGSLSAAAMRPPHPSSVRQRRQRSLRRGRFLLVATMMLLFLLRSPRATSGAATQPSESGAEAASAATAMLGRMRAAAQATNSASAAAAAGMAGGTAAAAAAPDTVQSVGQRYVMQALQRNNDSGALPSLPTLNALLRQVNGDGALQLNESFATAAAGSAEPAEGDVFSTMMGLGGGAGTGSAPVGAATTASASPFPSVSSVGSPGPLPGLSTAPAQLFALIGDGAGGSGGFGFGPGGGGGPGGVSPEVEAGLRAIRFGIYDSLFGYLPFAGFQLLAIGNWILLDMSPDLNAERASLVLFAVGNHLIGLGFLFIGIKGTEATEVAVRALAVILEEEALGKPTGSTAAGGAGAGAGARGSPSPLPVTGPVPAPTAGEPFTSVPPLVSPTQTQDSILGGLSAGLPFTAAASVQAQTATSTASASSSAPPYTFLQPSSANASAASASSGNRAGTGASGTVTAASVATASCPSLLYGSWLRIETDAASSLGSPAPKAAQQGDSVTLRFTATSFERVERVWVRDKRRTRQQHWSGSLHVECEFETPQGESAAAADGPSSSTLVTVSMAGAGAGALLDDQSTELLFTYLPVQLSGNTNGVLVERAAAAESPAAAAHRRAYIRI